MMATNPQGQVAMVDNDALAANVQSTVMATKYKSAHLRPIYIRDWLVYTGISQVGLADLMGTDKANVTRWIQEPRRITLDVISGVADALKPYAPELADAGNLLRHPDDARAITEAREAARRLIESLPSASAAPAPSSKRRSVAR